ncbi:MAG: hypothetical protein ACRDTD_11045 [Pseudonocardiaceae bacterium]
MLAPRGGHALRLLDGDEVCHAVERRLRPPPCPVHRVAPGWLACSADLLGIKWVTGQRREPDATVRGANRMPHSVFTVPRLRVARGRAVIPANRADDQPAIPA